MFFKYVQQQTSCFIFYLKLDLVLSLIAPLHWHSTLREAAELQRATKGKCPGESLETGRNSERVQRGIQRGIHCSKHLRVAASHGSVQKALSSQLVTVLHGNCCKWEHSENGNKNEQFLLSEHSIFGGCGSFRGRQSFKMRFLTGLKGALKAAARLFHWGRAVDLWGRNWNYFKCRVWWKIHDKQFKPLDKIYFIWIHKYRLHWCVCGAPRMGCGFAVLRNGAVFFHMGSAAWSRRAPTAQTANVSSTKRLLPPGLPEWPSVGVVDPSSSWASDVIVCDTVSGTSPSSSLFPSPAGARVPSAARPVSGGGCTQRQERGSGSGDKGKWQSSAQAPRAQHSPNTSPCWSAGDGGSMSMTVV